VAGSRLVSRATEDDELFQSVRLLQEMGQSDPRLDEWAEQYLAGRQAVAAAELSDMDGEFVVLLSNTHHDRVIRAIGPVTGRLTAEALATRLAESYDREWERYAGAITWTTKVVPLDSAADREQELDWLETRPEDEDEDDED
jgi:hypothetical protein